MDRLSSVSRSRSRQRNNQRQRRIKQGRPPKPGRNKPSANHNKSPINTISDQSDLQPKISHAKEIGITLSCHFFDFFQYFGESTRRGFVFTPQQRKQLQIEQQNNSEQIPGYQMILWSDNHEWDFRSQEIKIVNAIQKQNLPFTQDQIIFLKEVIHQVSAIFAQESTNQLYKLLIDIIKICLYNRFQSRERTINFMVKELRESNEYIFFNYKFSTLNDFKIPKKINPDPAYSKLALGLHDCLYDIIYKGE